MAEVSSNTSPSPGPIIVGRRELPLACPRPADTLWNLHPRVYLPIEKTGEATCPYCGARYQLRD